jgi:hypothetical protein
MKNIDVMNPLGYTIIKLNNSKNFCNDRVWELCFIFFLCLVLYRSNKFNLFQLSIIDLLKVEFWILFIFFYELILISRFVSRIQQVNLYWFELFVLINLFYLIFLLSSFNTSFFYRIMLRDFFNYFLFVRLYTSLIDLFFIFFISIFTILDLSEVRLHNFFFNFLFMN